MKHLLIALCISIFLTSCSKKTTQETHRLSEDLCLICDSASYHVIGNDTIRVGNIITPNCDGINDCFSRFPHNSKPDSAGLTIYNRDGGQVVHFDHYLNDWPKYIPGQPKQDLTGISNGLYRYKLSFPAGSIDGWFIIIYKTDEYIDKHTADCGCFHCCRCVDSEDPALIFL